MTEPELQGRVNYTNQLSWHKRILTVLISWLTVNVLVITVNKHIVNSSTPVIDRTKPGYQLERVNLTFVLSKSTAQT